MLSNQLAQLKENCDLSEPNHPLTTLAAIAVQGKLGEVNLGALNAYYESGQTVDIASLKEKKLIPPECTRIKILARGELDKPLTVYAENFSQKAIAKIIQQGGRAVQL